MLNLKHLVGAGFALGMLICAGSGAADSGASPKKPEQAECKKLPHGSTRATLDRSVIASPDSLNKVLKGDLKWSGEADGGFEGLFEGTWNTTHTPWNGKVSWSHPAGQGGFTAELILGDKGEPLFVTGRHIISLLDDDCEAEAYYMLKISPEAGARLSKAKTVTIRVTGLTEAPAAAAPAAGGQ